MTIKVRHPYMTTLFTILFDGVAYGMLLFVLACGLAVTLGLMNFVNLAHCAFAMLGGYVTAMLVNQFNWPFLATLPVAFLAAAATSIVFERVLYRRLYRASDLDQVLLTIGIAGYSGGEMARSPHVQHCLLVDDDSVHRIQETQAALGFALWSEVQSRRSANDPARRSGDDDVG